MEDDNVSLADQARETLHKSLANVATQWCSTKPKENFIPPRIQHDRHERRRMSQEQVYHSLVQQHGKKEMKEKPVFLSGEERKVKLKLSPNSTPMDEYLTQIQNECRKKLVEDMRHNPLDHFKSNGRHRSERPLEYYKYSIGNDAHPRKYEWSTPSNRSEMLDGPILQSETRSPPTMPMYEPGGALPPNFPIHTRGPENRSPPEISVHRNPSNEPAGKKSSGVNPNYHPLDANPNPGEHDDQPSTITDLRDLKGMNYYMPTQDFAQQMAWKYQQLALEAARLAQTSKVEHHMSREVSPDHEAGLKTQYDHIHRKHKCIPPPITGIPRLKDGTAGVATSELTLKKARRAKAPPGESAIVAHLESEEIFGPSGLGSWLQQVTSPCSYPSTFSSVPRLPPWERNSFLDTDVIRYPPSVSPSIVIPPWATDGDSYENIRQNPLIPSTPSISSSHRCKENKPKVKIRASSAHPKLRLPFNNPEESVYNIIKDTTAVQEPLPSNRKSERTRNSSPSHRSTRSLSSRLRNNNKGSETNSTADSASHVPVEKNRPILRKAAHRGPFIPRRVYLQWAFTPKITRDTRPIKKDKEKEQKKGNDHPFINPTG